MQAVVLHGLGDLRYEEDWPNPVLEDGWALVRVSAAGICGSDIARVHKTGSYSYPIVLGHEFCGVVEHIESSKYTVGDRVAVLPIIPCGSCSGCATGPFHCESYDFVGSRRNGGFAQFCTVPEKNLFRLPENMNSAEGAFIEPLLVALHVVRRSGLRPGGRALVFGGGAIGILIAQWARVLGASEVVLADIRDESLAVARSCGIENTVNPLSRDFEAIAGFDNCYEAAGAGAALLGCIDKATVRGTATVVGRDTSDTMIPLALQEKLMRKELDLRGCFGYDARGEEHFVYECLAGEKFSFNPMVTARLPLSEGPAAFDGTQRKEVFYCKYLFVME